MFAGIALLVAYYPALNALDDHVTQWFVSLRTPALNVLMIFITMLGDGRLLIVLCLVLLLGLAYYRQWFLTVFTLGVFTLSFYTVALFKMLFLRARPANLYSGTDAFSFPSGHASLSVVILGITALLLLSQNQHTRFIRTLGYALTALLCIGIAVSRVYVEAHWISDVWAGLALGCFIVALYSLIKVDRFHFPRSTLAILCLLVYVIAAVIYTALGFNDAMQSYGFLNA